MNLMVLVQMVAKAQNRNHQQKKSHKRLKRVKLVRKAKVQVKLVRVEWTLKMLKMTKISTIWRMVEALIT